MAREDELKPQPTVQHWTEKTAPMALEREDSDKDIQGDAIYRQTMSGKIAVGILIASGPGTLAMRNRRLKVNAMQGLNSGQNKLRKKGLLCPL